MIITLEILESKTNIKNTLKIELKKGNEDAEFLLRRL
jgi:hypothetical protein